MKKTVMMSSVFLAAATAAAAQTELPERILSGYTGMNLDGKIVPCGEDDQRTCRI